ncbi:MAG: type II secretion system F family protein [Alphaproteobacteria bacterium]|nr:type II secretion system F family protein [Alphaproteobacteria bacterium]
MDGIVTLENIVVLLAAVGSFITILGLGMALVQRDQLSSRMKAVAARREELSRQQKAKFQQRSRLQPKAHVGAMRTTLERLKLENLIGSKETRNKLAQAGWRNPGAPVTFAFTRVATPVVLLILVLVVTSGVKKFEFTFPVQLMVLSVTALIGFYLPSMIVSNAIQKRQQALTRSFPDALDLLVICVEAGLSIEAAFGRVADEIAESSPQLAEELGLTTAELAFLGDRRQAFENMSDRTGLGSTKSLATSLIQAEKYGTPVALALRVLSQENRDSRMALAEKKAGALPAQLTVPMILFFLPVLFIVIIGPAIIQSLRQFKGGG